MVTFLGVICFGIDYGLMCGAVFSVFTIVMRFYHPKLRLLGQIPYTEIYLDIRQHRAAKEVPGVKVIQFTSPLFFINKDMFQESVLKRTLKNQASLFLCPPFFGGQKTNQFINSKSSGRCSKVRWKDSTTVRCMLWCWTVRQ